MWYFVKCLLEISVYHIYRISWIKIVSNLLYKHQKISQTGFISNKSMLTLPYQCMFFKMFYYFISNDWLKNFTDIYSYSDFVLWLKLFRTMDWTQRSTTCVQMTTLLLLLLLWSCVFGLGLHNTSRRQYLKTEEIKLLERELQQDYCRFEGSRLGLGAQGRVNRGSME